MDKKPTNVKTKVFVATLIVALLIGVAAFAAAQANARATVENNQANAVREAVVRARASNSSGYSTIVSALGQQGNSDDTRQWLLANNGTILYVRDSSATNGYRDLPVQSYPGGEGIAKLLESASEGNVVHGNVSIDGQEYLGSATSFMLGGIQYDLCLLTATSALSGSTPTAPLMVLYALLAIALVLLVALPTLIASRFEKRLDEAKVPEAAPAEPDSAPVPFAQDEPEFEPGPDAEPEPEPEPEPVMLPLRTRAELEDHLREFLDSGIADGYLAKITCRDEEAMNRVLLRLGPLATGSDLHCYEFGDDTFIVELFEIDEPHAREALGQFLLDDGEITAFVPITGTQESAS